MTDLDVEVSDVALVDEHQPLQHVAHEANDITLIGHLVVVQNGLQVATAAAAGSQRSCKVRQRSHKVRHSWKHEWKNFRKMLR